MLVFISLIIISYLIGSIVPSIIISKKIGKDIRNYGSGNTGATNSYRTFGLKYGLCILFFDILKGIICSLLFKFTTVPNAIYYISFACLLGGMFPIFFNFRGGKGIATLLGILIIINPIYSILLTLIILLVSIITKYISLGSITAIIILLITMLLYNINQFIYLICPLSLILFKHRDNIKRLFSGNESKIF